TLNHWDLPDALQATGGWQNRDTVHRFVEYAERMAARLGDRLSTIATHNEPWVMATLGHDSGIFAPGVKSPAAAAQVAHHLLLSHGMALQALRDAGCRSELGIVLNQAPMQPATDTAEDAAKARLEDGRLVRWYMDPLFRGHYPEDVLAALGDAAPKVQPGDMELIAQPLDWLGINYYSRGVTSANDSWKNEQSGLPLTDMGWEVYPEGLTELLLRLKRDYAVPPLCITENGGAFKDELQDGRVDDHARTDYLVRHIAAVAEAMRQGVTMKGYMVWSLLDNFEWASGYEKRFGIVHVDYASQARTLKDSALWYRSFLQDQRQQHAAAPVTPTTPTSAKD
ncbi:family 1 glycosylhydrolase, partial [Ideonella sp.]|uniref:family 1 glycosylhydrolase n=1 Tax=Ideonella sp. TaxID=1929293 RepID=UPI003BB5C576